MLLPTACFAILLGSGWAAPAAAVPDTSGQFAQRSVTIGTVTYKLPDNWVFINTKCAENDAACQKKASDFLAKYQDSKGNSYSFLSNQNWLQCLSDCPGGSSSSGIDLDYCMQSASCLKDIAGTLAAAQTEASKSANPDNAADQGIETGNKEAARYLNNGNTTNPPVVMLEDQNPTNPPPSRNNPTPVTPPPGTVVKDAGGKVFVRNGPGSGSGSDDPSSSGRGPGGSRVGVGGSPGGSYPGQDYVQGGLYGSQDGQEPGLIGGIVDSSPFLRDRMFLASNASATDLRAMQRIGSDILNPIRDRIIGDNGDKTSGRTAFDGQSTNLPKDVQQRKCGTNFFGSDNCKK